MDSKINTFCEKDTHILAWNTPSNKHFFSFNLNRRVSFGFLTIRLTKNDNLAIYTEGASFGDFRFDNVGFLTIRLIKNDDLAIYTEGPLLGIS